MPANDDNTRHNNGTPSNEHAATIIHEADLLGIVEGTIDPTRLRAIRDELTGDKQLLARLARMKADREQLQTADADAQAPATLVHDAAARAAHTTLGFDALSTMDAAPSWPDELAATPHPAPIPHSHSDNGTPAIVHAATARVSPNATGHRGRLGWKARAAFAASLLLVIGGAIALTAFMGGLNPQGRTTQSQRPEIALAQDPNAEETNQALIDAFDVEILQREQLLEALAELIEHPDSAMPAIAELDIDELLRNAESIDEMLAAIADDLLDGGAWADASGAVEPGDDPVRHVIDASGISIAVLGRLARTGRLHVSLEARDPTHAAVQLLTLTAARGRNAAYAAELIDFAEMDAAEWTAAAPIAGFPGPGTMASPPQQGPTIDQPTDPQLARVQQLLREIREREDRGGADGERTDPVYRVTMAGLSTLDDEAAGLAVIGALEGMVLAGDRLSFYELSGANTPVFEVGQDEPGFTMQMYVRDRARNRR